MQHSRIFRTERRTTQVRSWLGDIEWGSFSQNTLSPSTFSSLDNLNSWTPSPLKEPPRHDIVNAVNGIYMIVTLVRILCSGKSSLTVAAVIHQSSKPHALFESLVYTRNPKRVYAKLDKIMTVAVTPCALSP